MEILPFLLSILVSILSIVVYLRINKLSVKWKYIIRKQEGKKLPNVDQGYWETTGPIGQKLRFTDDAVETAHKRYLSNEGDRIKFVDSKFSPKK